METTPLLDRPNRLTLKTRFSNWLNGFTFSKRGVRKRTIKLGELPENEFPSNYVCNQKYTLLTFVPFLLYEQFKLFQNFYFLIMALSQFFPAIRIGYLYTYWGPLGFVIAATAIREAIDDFRRYRQDRDVNTQQFERVILDSENRSTNMRTRSLTTEYVAASSLRVGDIVVLEKGQRVPADMILLRTNESLGTVYIRTDQLDGETDWKLRMPVPATQALTSDLDLITSDITIEAEKPQPDIYTFIGKRIAHDVYYPLDIENTMWSGCVLASSHAIGLIVYTGTETRTMMKKSTPRSKVGRLDLQANNITKVLFLALLFLSFLEIILKGFGGPWYRYLFRFILLFSYIIPISLRVNLDMAKVLFSWMIQRDQKIPGTIVRSTTIPEELGRIEYLMADKTGTLTKNEMLFKKLCLRNETFDENTFHEVESLLTQYVTEEKDSGVMTPSAESSTLSLKSMNVTSSEVWETVLSLALCHNVTPVYMSQVASHNEDVSQSDMTSSVASESCGGAVPQQQLCEYQAASPDEVALVKWTDMMGVSLYKRDLRHINLKLRAANEYTHYDILRIFPFTSETKTMGIIIQNRDTLEITYYVKGADTAIYPLLNQQNPGLLDTTNRLASEGLRTLVYAKRMLTQDEYEKFEVVYREAKLVGKERMVMAINTICRDLTLLGVTGVEDRLAPRVATTLTELRTAGIKVWMLTGDKSETALCIARSLPLAANEWKCVAKCLSRQEAYTALNELNNCTDLIIEGDTLEVFLQHYEEETVTLLTNCTGVVIARCSPTQKTRAVHLLRLRRHVVAAIGDGGNDVAMIREADLGIGIEGSEGRAAWLAGDVSVRTFANVSRLILVHGRRCGMRSASLCLFILHRGLIISIMQALFSCVFYFSSVSIYPSFLMIGYGTIYTMLPVFLLVIDKDLPGSIVMKYPQLYKHVVKGKQLSYKTFFIWTAISIYQGGTIMYGALFLFEGELIHIVAISYTSLILTELIMVALTIVKWHWLMVVAQLSSLVLYILTLFVFNEYFDADFIRQWNFIWKVTVITLISCLPLYVVKLLRIRWNKRRSYRNLQVDDQNPSS